MSEKKNAAVARASMEAFARGDVEAVLGTMSEDVDFRLAGSPDDLPWAVPCKGREEVGRLFGTMDELIEFEFFEPREYIAEGDRVAAVVHEEWRVKATGNRFEQDFVAILTIKDGKIAYVRCYEDTAAEIAALKGAEVLVGTQ